MIRELILRWLRVPPVEPEPCAEAMPLLLEPEQPHPGGAHICRLLPGHLSNGFGHACRNCTVQWWPR